MSTTQTSNRNEDLLIKSIKLDHCWVCSQRFTDAKPPGPENRHEHHMVPQAYGGKDGPTVSLCDGHHNTLHRIAVAMKAGKPYFQYLTGESQQRIQRLVWLATIVYRAELATRNDPNKAASVLMTLNHRHKTMIDRLRKVYPKARSREAILHAALESLYKRHFTD